MRGMKALLAAVIVMGVAILLGTAVLISVVVHRALHRPTMLPPVVMTADPALPAPDPRPTAPPALALDQPPGTRIVSVARQSDALLVVALAGGGEPDRVVIWDLANNRVAASLRLDH